MMTAEQLARLVTEVGRRFPNAWIEGTTLGNLAVFDGDTFVACIDMRTATIRETRVVEEGGQ